MRRNYCIITASLHLVVNVQFDAKKITSKPYDNMFILLFNQNNLIIGALKRKYYKCPFPCWLKKIFPHNLGKSYCIKTKSWLQ